MSSDAPGDFELVSKIRTLWLNRRGTELGRDQRTDEHPTILEHEVEFSSDDHRDAVLELKARDAALRERGLEPPDHQLEAYGFDLYDFE